MDSITQGEVDQAITTLGEWLIVDVKFGDIRTFSLRPGITWVRCPLVAVGKRAAAKRLQVGWHSYAPQKHRVARSSRI